MAPWYRNMWELASNMSVFYELFYCILISAFCWLKYEMQKKKLQIKQITLKTRGWWIPTWICITIQINMYNWESIFSRCLRDFRISGSATRHAKLNWWVRNLLQRSCGMGTIGCTSASHITVYNRCNIFKKFISYIFLTLQRLHADLNICNPSISCNFATVTGVMYEL